VSRRPNDGKVEKIAFIFYSFPSFVKKDYDTLSSHYLVKKVSYKGVFDIPSVMEAVRGSDLSVSWFAGGHAFLMVLFSKLFRKKSLIIVGGFDVAYMPEINYGRFAMGWITRMITKLTLKYTDKALVVDPSLKGDAIKNAGISGKNIDYLPTGYSSERFKPSGKKETLVITVGYISDSVLRRKGLDTFVIAASHVPEAKFALIGKPVDESIELLKKRASENVEFTGYISDEELLRYYQRAKVYCQLSAYEGLPNALCEAMLCECVPVGTKRNGIPTAIGDTGFYVPYGDIEATAEAIKKALNSSDELGRNARMRIKDVFPEERRRSGIIDAIDMLFRTA
jgi:glycosyltransferase involved in cell wall biosynthesis